MLNNGIDPNPQPLYRIQFNKFPEFIFDSSFWLTRQHGDLPLAQSSSSGQREQTCCWGLFCFTTSLSPSLVLETWLLPWACQTQPLSPQHCVCTCVSPQRCTAASIHSWFQSEGSVKSRQPRREEGSEKRGVDQQTQAGDQPVLIMMLLKSGECHT